MIDEDISKWIENFDPDGDPPDLHSTFGPGAGDDIIDIIIKFCEEVNARLSTFTQQGPSTLDIFENEKYLKAEYLGQETHTFLRQFLIESIVESLGYSFLIEPRPAQTERAIWSDDVYPDLRLLPRNWPKNESVPTIIIEHKKFGRYEHASKELREDYLQKASKPVFGIATDILRWGTFEVTKSGEIIPLERAPLARPLRKIRQSVDHDNFEFKREQLKIGRLLRLYESIPGNVQRG
jgi:hypothetical protein